MASSRACHHADVDGCDMAGQSANHRDLLDFVRSIDGRGARPDAVEIQQRLEEAEPIFQNLLRYKVDPQSRFAPGYMLDYLQCIVLADNMH